MDTKLRPSGIEGLGDMAWGTHFCLFYETKEDLLDILIPYFKARLENNEIFLCVASPPLSTKEAQRAMRESVPDFERYLLEGQIEIVSYLDWLLTGGRFDAQRVLQNWIAKLNWALSKGYAGLRFAGDPSWLDKHDQLLKLNAELEQRVAERTTELTFINEQLRAEIGERKRVEEALRESEEKFSAAFRASPIALVIGFHNEPAYQGEPNGLDMFVTNMSTGEPVNGLEGTLKVEIIYGASKRELTMETQFGQDGAHTAYALPTEAGDYTWHIWGDID